MTIRMPKTALITGITGQDGAYLAQWLLARDYRVVGTTRSLCPDRAANLARLGLLDELTLEALDLEDYSAVERLVGQVAPDEIYHLAGQSSVGLSFAQPLRTFRSIGLGTLHLLETMRRGGRAARFFNAASGECFGDTGDGAARECTPFRPQSPYAIAKAAAFWQTTNYREAYGLFTCSGILFNHESALRDERFVTGKIVAAACRIALGSQERLHLGDLSVQRDWGWAPEYVEAMWLMLQQDHPDDYVIATGESGPLTAFVEQAFAYVGLDWQAHVDTETGLRRPLDARVSRADPGKACQEMGWRARSGMREVVRMMVDDRWAASAGHK
jgi:GDPmannose 4,6-dehydratase